MQDMVLAFIFRVLAKCLSMLPSRKLVSQIKHNNHKIAKILTIYYAISTILRASGFNTCNLHFNSMR